MANKDLENWVLAGEQSLERKDFQKAVELFEAVLKIDIFHEKAWSGLIEIFKVKSMLLRKIEISSSFLLQKPQALEKEERFELAQAFYTIVLVISPGCREASEAIKRLSKKTRYYKKDKRKVSKLLQLAHQKRKQKKNKEAIGLYKQVLQINSLNKVAFSWLKTLVAIEEKKQKPSCRQDLVKRNSFWGGVNRIPRDRTASFVSGIKS